MKENALTWGDLELDSVFLYIKKSAEVIVPIYWKMESGIEYKKCTGWFHLLGRTERQVVSNSIRKLSGLFGSSLILNYDKGVIGVKSDDADI